MESRNVRLIIPTGRPTNRKYVTNPLLSGWGRNVRKTLQPICKSLTSEITYLNRVTKEKYCFIPQGPFRL